MKLGVAYNAFDALELLGPSIDSIRGVADYVCVVYQLTSNFGQQMPKVNRGRIESLRKSGVVDEFVEYNPVVNGGHRNEIEKRNLGMEMCKKAGCDYHMTMDVDEFYVEEELQRAFDLTVFEGYDASACKMLTYWHSASYIVDPPEEYYVPLIYKMDDRLFDLRNRWKVAADPTRRLVTDRMRLFERDEIQMHHFSYVREDIMSKLNNSSASVNFKHKIDKLASYYRRWKPGRKAWLAGSEDRFFDVKEVVPQFDI